MASIAYPVNLSAEQYQEVKRTAEKTGLSMADVIRQSLKIGLPWLEHQLCVPASTVTSADQAKSWFLSHSEGKLCCFKTDGTVFTWVTVQSFPEAEQFYAQKTLPASSAPVSRS